MDDLGVSGLLSFEQSSYINKQGKEQPMICFSDAVIFPVVAAVGGKGESRLLPRGSRL
jgi:hypothetical protein